ncbi:MAG TPA: hypothetical protein VL281_10665 [Mycobacteriales bacterium]|nr:hypothetical protein [Mycobacteriales bacterium]
MTGRAKAYFGIRGVALVAFVLSWSVMPPGMWAAGVAIVAGIAGILTCIGVNAGGPGEQAGARLEATRFERVRPPQGDWPPYDEDRIVEGEVVRPSVRPPDQRTG